MKFCADGCPHLSGDALYGLPGFLLHFLRVGLEVVGMGHERKKFFLIRHHPP